MCLRHLFNKQHFHDAALDSDIKFEKKIDFKNLNVTNIVLSKNLTVKPIRNRENKVQKTR
jgi:hypothetical protein